jgi:hypothetical protein
LYSIPAPPHSFKFSFGVNKPSLTRWHDRLAHPSFQIVQRVLRDFNLPCQFVMNKDSICGPCQQAKSHQQPYPKSTSTSSYPLEFIFSDVWGSTPESVGRYKYYASFVDDYSKFTWIYLLKFKSEVFQKFHDFQSLVEHSFGRKIITVQSDWEANMRSLTPSLPKLVLLIKFRVLTLINRMALLKESIATL